MKKLLILLGAVAISGSGVASVAACNETKKTKKTDKNKVDAIKDKIKVLDLTVPEGTNTDASKDKAELDKALKAANQSLTTPDLATISYAGTLVAGKAQSVTATITIGSAKDTVTLKVTLEQTDKQKVDAIKDKIKVLDLTVPEGTNTDASKDKAELDKALKAANQSLTTPDLATISYAGTLVAGKAQSVTATITIGSAKDTVTLNVTLAKTPYTPLTPSTPVASKAILSKIKNTDFVLNYATLPDTKSLSTIQAIKTAIRQNNSNSYDQNQNITLIDLNSLTITGPNLSSNAKTTLTVTSSSPKDKGKSVDITVKINTYNNKSHFLAPFIDMGELGGNPHVKSLPSIISNTGLKHVMLAFIQQDITASGMKPAWFGSVPIDGSGSAAAQAALKSINNQIQQAQSEGVGIGISLGGESGTPIWTSTASYTPTVADIQKALEQIIDQYHLKWIDFDIEGNEVTNQTGLAKLGKALNAIQSNDKYKDLQVTMTVASDAAQDHGINPLFDEAWTALGNALKKMPIINVMAMDYGQGWATKSMYDGAVKTATDTANTTAKLWATSKFKLTGDQILHQYMGITPMLGNNDSFPQNFTKLNAEQLGVWAQTTGIRWIGYWSQNRDFAGPKPGVGQVSITDSGTYQQPYDYANIFTNTYGDSSDPHGSLSGNIAITSFTTTPNALSFFWTPIENSIFYTIYFDNKIIQLKDYGSSGFFKLDSMFTPGTHTVKVVAHGVSDEITSQDYSIKIPDATSVNNIIGQMVVWKNNTTYKAPGQGMSQHYIIGEYQNKWQVFQQEWWINPGQTLASLVGKNNALRPVMDLSALQTAGGISALAVKEIEANQLPTWYPENF